MELVECVLEVAVDWIRGTESCREIYWSVWLLEMDVRC